MTKWQTFERLVARIHELLDGANYEIEHNVRLSEPYGETPQIDVKLTPKNGLTGPILVSCKAWEDKVGVEHIREWADIVQQQGAAAGIIVSRSGFTRGAKNAAQNPTRRVQLWIPRELTLDDFGPDEASPSGYIARLGFTTAFLLPRPVEESFKIDVEPADRNRSPINYMFGEEHRDDWYLRDASDKVVGNLWDQYVQAARRSTPGVVRIEPDAPTYLVLEGRRFSLIGLSFELQVDKITDHHNIDFTRLRFAYENVLTGQVRQVPLPPEVLQD